MILGALVQRCEFGIQLGQNVRTMLSLWHCYGKQVCQLVPRVTHSAGYSRRSLIRASTVVNCQSAVV